ncbi:MAG: anhydro-N-acetylmuramic acid kinase [Proteobacteria bacterium]|nr:anhydro-N-acetylmuramic acid kinase [Pseudomonadota bacterium]
MSKTFRAIGLMSGTSLDGIDLALIESNGEDKIQVIGNDYFLYEPEFRNKLRSLIFSTKITLEDIKVIENELTIQHAYLVNNFLQKNNLSNKDIDVIGFHGHTIYHNPAQKITWQIGNSQLLASMTKINVIGDFRINDVIEGGQGAPLVPIYHYYLFSKIDKPSVILNIGGICNLTYFDDQLTSLTAFDVCFGNAPMNDLVFKKLGREFDENGDIARSGSPHIEIAKQIIHAPIFNSKIPRSFSRNDFDIILQPLEKLELRDALATHIYVICEILARDIENNLPHLPKKIVVCGGGSKNYFLLENIQKRLPKCKVISAKKLGFNVDFIEAEAFGFLAIRKLLNLSISFSKTTGTKSKSGSKGGVLFEVN